jgi:hypothetical protein
MFGEVNEHDWTVDLVGHLSLGGFGNVVTVDVGGTVFLVNTVFGKVLDGVSVVESEERSLRSDKVWVEGLDNLSSNGVSEEVVDNVADLSVSMSTQKG